MKPESWKNRMQEYIQEHKLRRRWLKITASLGAFAVVVTAAAMILPAITMENAPQMLECQIGVHTHKDSCYDAEGNIVCGYADFVVHTHNDSCYAEDGTLICPLDEIETHTHDASCYRESRVPTCGLEEGSGHVHEGHIHTEACYEVSNVLTCGQAEAAPHTHDEHCYDADGNLICQQSEEGHTHTAECYETQKTLICTQDTGCYDATGNLICQQSEEGHTHTDDCYETQKELVCRKEEIILHTHTNACFDENGNLTCGMPEVKEHIHDESCMPQTKYIPSGSSWATVSKPDDTLSTENDRQPSSNRMFFAAPQAETGSYDFSGDITSVTVERQQGGQWIQSDTFTDGDTIRITIRYAIPQGTINETQRNALSTP